jgi:hypothetical protein
MAEETAQPNGQGAPAEGQAPQQQGQPQDPQQPTQPQGQPSQPAAEYPYQPDQPGITDDNYRQDPAWKKAQAGYQKQINALQGQLQQIQAEAEKQRMAGMSETEQLQYAADQWRQEAMKQAQTAQSIQAEYRRNEDLNVIQASTGVPAQAVAQYLESIGSNSAHDAWAWAVQQGRAQGTQPTGQAPPVPGASPQQFPPAQPQQQAPSQFQDARFQAPPGPPQVDVGGGQVPGTATQIQQRYDDARKQYDMAGMMGAMQEADNAGVEIKEW